MMSGVNRISAFLKWIFFSPAFYTIYLHLFFLGLLFVSYLYFLERTIPFDAALYSFKVLAKEGISIENGRWGAFYNQLLPLLGVKMGCSLPVFLKLYSLSFALCNYAFALVIYYRFKQVYTAIALVLVQLVGYRYNFYYQVSEIHAIIGPVFLLLAVLLSGRLLAPKKIMPALVVFLLIFWILNIHILAVLIILFILAYAFIHQPALLKNKILWAAIGLALVYFFILLQQVKQNDFQNEKLLTLGDIKKVFTDTGTIPGFQHFISTLKQKYYLPLFALAFIPLAFYLVKKQWLKLLLFAGAFTGLWVIIISHGITPGSPIDYENYYALFAYIICIPFCIDVLQKLKKKFTVPVLLLVMVVSTMQILKCGIMFSQQVAYFERTTQHLRQLDEKKFNLSHTNLPWEITWVTWDYPFQSLLVSSLQSPDSAITFFASADTNLHKPHIYRNTNVFIGPDFNPGLIRVSKIPKKYFRLKSTRYRTMNTLQDTIFDLKTFNDSNMSVQCEKDHYSLYRSDFRLIPIGITNRSPYVLRSVPGKYHWAALGHRLYEEGTNRLLQRNFTVLETDVYPGLTVWNAVKIPAHLLERGRYTVEAGLIDEKHEWMVKPCKFSLEIK